MRKTNPTLDRRATTEFFFYITDCGSYALEVEVRVGGSGKKVL